MFNNLKKKALSMIWPAGSKAKIVRGPLKGRYFIISENSGWSPIVGRWEPESQQLFLKIIQPGWVVYDLGANNGIHSLLFSQLVGDTGKVYSFEPLADNCREIRDNATLNNIKNIDIKQVAVSNQSGETIFHLGLHDKQGSLVGIGLESGNDIQVTMITLDEFVTAGNSFPDFLKIDIEGAESMALQGFSQQIAIKHPHLFIELHTPEQDKKVGSFLLEQGYVAYRLTDNTNLNDLGITGLERIKDLKKVHPHPEGIWGTVLAVHHSRILSITQGMAN
jgi:FkbM family methyltransferase